MDNKKQTTIVFKVSIPKHTEQEMLRNSKVAPEVRTALIRQAVALLDSFVRVKANIDNSMKDIVIKKLTFDNDVTVEWELEDAD